MIFIITPYLIDFKRTCKENQIQCVFGSNGMPLHSWIKWIHDPQQLYGMIIKEQDKIFYGEQCDKFEPEVLERIKIEIELRKKHK